MKRSVLLGVLFSLVGLLSYGEERLYDLPDRVGNVLSLNGEWQFKRSAESEWNKIMVPGEAVMQGYGIEHDKAFYYRRDFDVSTSFKDQKIILRFDGVYSYAKLFVNGTLVREHKGGFTRWESDITKYVKLGAKNLVELEVVDPVDEISYASGYAHHPVGGILRGVTLYALPKTHVYNFGAETHLDKEYKDAVLKLAYWAEDVDGAQIEYKLSDSKGKVLIQSKFNINNGENVNALSVKNPLKWDAEHPNLYQLAVTVTAKGGKEYRFNKQIGFREVKVVGDQLMVNGVAVKLRGACRHDIHPSLGRTTTAELDSLDVLLFKESNMNFVRTSHYPPSEKFVEFCDRFGVYVEAESAVCFVDTYRQKNYAMGATQSDPNYTAQYLSQCREMVKTFRSHPSVIIWSIGNESLYGSNFQKCWDWVKANDTTRPVIWSYPGAQSGDAKIYDILSMHYQDAHGNLTQFGKTTRNFQGHGIPALFDEWAHPACYTFATLRTDPNIREFWGKSIDMMWSGLYSTQGGLGGAIWGYIDETFMVPKLKEGKSFWVEFARSTDQKELYGECVGYGEWGIVDVWRRKKPEFWSTKKAHSPIRLLVEGKVIDDFVADAALNIPVYNRFDHTNLNEITVEYSYRGATKRFQSKSLPARNKGIITIPAEKWAKGEIMGVRFYDASQQLIDAYEYSLGEQKVELPRAEHGGVLQVKDEDGRLIVSGDNFEIPFSKSTGLIEKATVNGEVIIEKGPFLNMYINLNHLSGAEVRKVANKFVVNEEDWKKSDLTYAKSDDKVLVTLTGAYKDVDIQINMRILQTGAIDFSYTTSGEPNGYLREIGLQFYLPNTISNLKWMRNGYWNYYPENSFSGNIGQTSLTNSKQAKYGEPQNEPWHQDTHNYYYHADKGAQSGDPLTQQSKAMKENIYYYTLLNSTTPIMSVVSEKASVACRMDRREDEQLILYINNRWDYPEIAWGNYCKQQEVVPTHGVISVVF